MADRKQSNLTPAEKLLEKRLNPDAGSDSEDRSQVSEARKLIDKEVESGKE